MRSDYVIVAGVVAESQRLLNLGGDTYCYSFDYVSPAAPWYHEFKGKSWEAHQ